MVVFINGSFGVGKTTLATQLVEQIPGAVLFDPEIVGSQIHRVLGRVRPVDDFQDYRLWRWMTVFLIKRQKSPCVVVPMTIVDPVYFEQTIRRLPDAHHFALEAREEEIRRRLEARGPEYGPDTWAWVRVERCCQAVSHFPRSERIDATGTPDEILSAVLERLKGL